jgi:hypothetical protein
MIVRAYGLAPQATERLLAWVAKGYPRLLWGTPFAEKISALSDKAYFQLAEQVGPKVMALAREHGAPLKAAGHSLEARLTESLARKSRDRHMTGWAIAQALEQAVQAMAKHRQTLSVSTGANAFLESASELTGALLLGKGPPGLEVIPVEYGIRSAYRLLRAKLAVSLAQRARQEKRSYEEVLKQTEDRGFWRAASGGYSAPYKEGQAGATKLAEAVEVWGAGGLDVVAWSSNEDRSYE